MEVRMKKAGLVGLLLLLLPLVACSPQSNSTTSAPNASGKVQPLVAGAIPDQDPEKLQRLYGKLADYLTKSWGCLFSTNL